MVRRQDSLRSDDAAALSATMGLCALAPEDELHDAWPARHGAAPHAPTAGFVPSQYFPAPACYDRFYLSSGLLPRLRGISVDAFADGSDHQPVILDLGGPEQAER